MICPKCGNEVKGNAAFCNNCGASLQAFSNNSNGFVNNTQPPQNNSNSSFYYIPNRSIGLCILFSIITCGIYGLYWLYKLTEETNYLSGDTNATSGGIVIILSIVTCGIYGWYWLYKQGERIDRIKTMHNMPPSNSSLVYLLLGIFGLAIISYAIMQNEINNFATK
ncbi:MAG: DUF4234 domain-containing protein [Ruminococcus sp.]|nr:DUF4234 domain-containing protein [Ruminococcus sp.]